jgi:hypothetical protein
MDIYKAIPLDLYNKLMNKKPNSSSSSSSTVLEGEASMLSSKGKQLLTRLENNKKLSWLTNGEFTYENQTIQNSNIFKLINYVTSNKNIDNLIGLEIFLEALRDFGISRDSLSKQAQKTLKTSKPGTWIRFDTQ